MVQILAGLITYLLLAIYCHEKRAEPVSIFVYVNSAIRLAMRLYSRPKHTEQRLQEVCDREDSKKNSCNFPTGHYYLLIELFLSHIGHCCQCWLRKKCRPLPPLHVFLLHFRFFM